MAEEQVLDQSRIQVWTEGPPSEKLKLWAELRELIVHEDNLVNQRFTWLLTLEGFLLAGYFAFQSTVAQNKVSGAVLICEELLLCFVLIGALIICFNTGNSISAAQRQVSSAQDAWVLHFPEEAQPECPVPSWFMRSGSRGKSSYRPLKMPVGSAFPPIRGEFKYGWTGGTGMIVSVIFTVNALAAFSCPVIGYFTLINNAKAVQTLAPVVQQPAQCPSPWVNDRWCF